jgi:hypothetical protein
MIPLHELRRQAEEACRPTLTCLGVAILQLQNLDLALMELRSLGKLSVEQWYNNDYE